MKTRFDFPKPVILLGGFSCNLTGDEQNQWRDFLHSQPAYRRLQEVANLVVACEACISGGAVDRERELLELIARKQALENDLYHIGKAWYAELTKS